MLIFPVGICGCAPSISRLGEVMVVGAVAVVLIIGSALAWYAMRKPKAATEVGGSAGASGVTSGKVTREAFAGAP